jgi:hypothetical protein
MTSPQPPAPPGWHVTSLDLVAYRDGNLRGVSADSVEAHLLRCEHCRLVLAASSPSAARDALWESIVAEVDRPTGWSNSATWWRLALGTPDLAITAALLALAFLAVPILVGLIDQRAAVTWFLALAPAVPISIAALAYGATADPGGELSAATPMHSFRLVAFRTLLLLGVLVPIGIVVSILLPVPATLALGWLIPALAACAVVLAAGAHWSPRLVGLTLSIGWAVVVLADLTRARRLPVAEALEELSVNQPYVQLLAAIVGVAAAGWFIVHRDDVTYRELL